MTPRSARRWVLDTNVVVAGLLWQGIPRLLLDQAIDGHLRLFTSPTLIDELARTLAYPKFAARIRRFDTRVEALVAHYTALTTAITPATTPQVVARDPDDDHVIACAVAAHADLIVSGDKDLLDLGRYRGIAIVAPAQAIARIEAGAE